jgi:hypothetical protein
LLALLELVQKRLGSRYLHSAERLIALGHYHYHASSVYPSHEASSYLPCRL